MALEWIFDAVLVRGVGNGGGLRVVFVTDSVNAVVCRFEIGR